MVTFRQIGRAFPVLLFLAAAVHPGLAAAADSVPSYNHDIRPILAERCFHCHGQDETARKAGLRLDQPEVAYSTLPSGAAAIVPGNAEAGELMRRITTTDVDKRMPPPKSGPALDAADVEKLRAWIAQGAKYEPHWAYVKPVRPEVPTVQNTAWTRNAIDRFVLARIEEEGAAPAPEADAYTLIRRLSLDLTGLPPSIEEADAFVNDVRPDRVDWAVDRLLASPAYGEHLGRQWLDLARYADSSGYHIDTKRSMWPYRDWVIQAFNRNMPFDEFTVAQLAGDLLPDATLEQRVATGFHRNTLFNEEGGIDPEEFRTKAVVDRVGTTMTTWMATTMACAQCHEHKYDPFTQAEFYQLYAFFDNVPEVGGGTGASQAPLVTLPLDATQQAEADSLRSVIAELESRRVALEAAHDAALPAWAAAVREQAGAWKVLQPASLAAKDGSKLELVEDGSVLATGDLPAPSIDTFTVEVTVPLAGIQALGVEVMPDERLPGGGPGRTAEGAFVLTHLEVAKLPGGEPARLKDARAVYIDEKRPPAKAIDEDPSYQSGWSTGKHPGQPDTLVVSVEGLEKLEPGTTLRVTLTQRLSNYLIGRFRLWAADRPAAPDLAPPHLATALQRDAAAWTSAERAALLAYYRSLQPERLDLRMAELQAKVEAIEKTAPTSLVMADMETPRETHVHVRGNFLQAGDLVRANVPAVWPPLQAAAESRATRLDLARWLVSPENPLTARVMVNRLWAMLFGHGLVETVDDFGVRGTLPTHPQLLDYLAVEFVESGWDVKTMLRLMVTSATYRQTAAVGEEAYQRDPKNALLARGPRFRLDAETVRDNALAISGLLVRKVGGPPAHPYQPAGLYEEKVQTGYGVGAWPVETGDDLYRRGVYTFRRRSVPYPTFQTFDTPSFEYCTASRARTNTPLQALTTLNDPQFVEAARVLAQRIMEEASGDVEKRILVAVRRCLTRPPAEREIAHLRAVYKQQLAAFQADPAAAEQFVRNGRSPIPESLPKAEFAAWTAVANVLLNLDETITKG